LKSKNGYQMKPNNLKFLLVCLIVFLLPSCTLFFKDAKKQASKAIYADNNQIKSWNVSGKIAIKNNNVSNSFNLNWQQRDDVFVIKITNILGFKVMQLNGDNSSVKLEISADVPAKGTYQAANFASLEIPNFALNLPFDELKYWLLAISAPKSIAQIETNNLGQVRQISQNGYLISYKNHQLSGKHYLPGRLNITNQYHDGELILALKNWQINNLKPL